MNITVAIPTFNRALSLKKTLESVAKLVIPEDVKCRLLVVDNGSTDDTSDVTAMLSRWFPWPNHSVVENRSGLSHARNRALAETSDEHVVFFDDDVSVSESWIAGYSDAVNKMGGDCVVGPVFPVLPEHVPRYANPFVLSFVTSNYSRKGDVAHVMPSSLASEVPGCNFGFRRSIATRVGGFDGALGRTGGGLLAGEDSDFGLLVSSIGGTLVYEPRCSIRHYISPFKLNQESLRRRATGLGASCARLHAKHGVRVAPAELLKRTRRAVGLFSRWQYRRLGFGDGSAFEWELRMRMHVANLVHSMRLEWPAKD